MISFKKKPQEIFLRVIETPSGLTCPPGMLGKFYWSASRMDASKKKKEASEIIKWCWAAMAYFHIHDFS